MAQEESEVPRPAGDTRQGLAGTLGNIGQDVQETVETVSGMVRSVKSALDPVDHMRRHPWAAFAGCVFAGFLLGTLLSGRR